VPEILLTNDDGVSAPGLLALRRRLIELGPVTVAAPAFEQSAVSHSLTLMHPVVVNSAYDAGERIGFSVDGKPADCVKIALAHLVDRKPDWVVSGMNAGANAGINVLYSGTVAAAVEAAFFGVPAVAVSLAKSSPETIEAAARIALRTLRAIFALPPAPGLVYNVNLPDLARGEPKGIRVTPQGFEFDPDAYEARTDPRGRRYYWLLPDKFVEPKRHDTDLGAIEAGFVSVTPLRFDLTAHERLARLADLDQTW
jgi:5'-nucleotidase